MTNKCLFCYEPLVEGGGDYHAKCCRKLFGTSQTPILPYTSSEVRELADEVVRSQTTVTGVQPKLSLDFDQLSHSPKRFTIVGLWGRFILKPQTEHYSHLPELEDVSMHLAEIAKIETVPHGLMRFNDGELCYITRRIDRTEQGEKLPMEDMCQLSERLTEYKYKGSHEQVAKLISKYSSVPKLDLVKYWEQVLFSWLIGNADMHLKNYSLYAPVVSEYQLTPAYDLLSTALVIPEDTEELALTLCGKKRKLSRRHFLEAMAASGLDEKVCDNIFARFGRILPEWEDFICKSFLPQDMQVGYIELIKNRFIRLLE